MQRSASISWHIVKSLVTQSRSNFYAHLFRMTQTPLSAVDSLAIDKVVRIDCSELWVTLEEFSMEFKFLGEGVCPLEATASWHSTPTTSESP